MTEQDLIERIQALTWEEKPRYRAVEILRRCDLEYAHGAERMAQRMLGKALREMEWVRTKVRYGKSTYWAWRPPISRENERNWPFRDTRYDDDSPI